MRMACQLQVLRVQRVRVQRVRVRTVVPFVHRPRKEDMVVCPKIQVPGSSCLVRYYAPGQDRRFIDGTGGLQCGGGCPSFFIGMLGGLGMTDEEAGGSDLVLPYC